MLEAYVASSVLFFRRLLDAMAEPNLPPFLILTSSNPFPIEENNIASAITSVNITQPSGYNNDAAYDILV